MNAAKLWPIAIVGVLAVTVAANAVLLYEANDREAATVEPDYYRKAVAWDSTLAQRARDAALGWRIDARLGAIARDGAPLIVRLTDARGLPVAGAAIEVVAIHNIEASRPARAAMRPAPDGAYEARLPLSHAGLWELRFTVTRGAERFTASLRRDTGAIAP
jgi:nitrogen fixation protein FixH